MPLQTELAAFGRRGRRLAPERLLEFDDLLALLGEPDRLNDIAYRQDLAVRITTALKVEIASMTDRVDRRIAEALLAAAPEFYDKFVNERLAYEASHGRQFTAEQYKNRRRRVLADLTAALDKRLQEKVAPLDGTELPAAPYATTTDALLPLQPSLVGGSKWARPWKRRPHVLRGRRLIAASAVVSLGALAGAVAAHNLDWQRHASTRQSEVALPAATFDDKDPRSLEGNPCADAPLSQPAYPAGPEVIGPDGTPVATIQLRTRYSCPVVWPRIIWDVGPDLNVDATYQIPDGWTLQVLTVRPETRSVFRYPEPSSGAVVPYALGKMASSAQHCVKVEVYFTNGADKTPLAETDCIYHDGR
ncbi:hypothetical protein [Rhodococcus ruber]|uniref:hypothetical protein n=1 Tax=Rhodococcus ruber TaxID=1830 RepID=UPI000F52EF5B|nr:hypothetical protein [Rhodococcus ruber]RQM32199.1 hypothetical protein TN91_21905 [Rhodococcus ruber]